MFKIKKGLKRMDGMALGDLHNLSQLSAIYQAID